MDSWENLIIHWINCLHDNTNDYAHAVKELQDGRIYCKLINKLKPRNCKEYSDCQRDTVIQFLKDEYPNFTCNNTNDITENLCIALLILSRLSLEPMFHKSLCMNLNFDLQIKIKSILESIYALGKNVTADDLCKTFSLSDKTDFKSLSTRSKRILEEFLNSPVIRSVQSEKKMYEQTKQIRHLRADIETIRYEKSELIEDIKIQKKQIEELQNKLQDTLSELKVLRADSSKTSNLNHTNEAKDMKSIESTYEKELQSLEKYVTELQNDNCKLQDERNHLINEIKSCKTMCRVIEEKNTNNDQIIESMLLQIEKKDDELTELKIRHEELRNYLKEKSIYLNNQSFEMDDKMICETSFNNSEALSSVIEIQLQDTKKEFIIMQNKFKNLNTLITIIIEEYEKLKRKFNILSTSGVEIKTIDCEKCKLMENQDKKSVKVKDSFVHLEQHNVIEDQCVSTELTNAELQSIDYEKCKLINKQDQNSSKINDNFIFQEQYNIIEDQCVSTELTNLEIKAIDCEKCKLMEKQDKTSVKDCFVLQDQHNIIEDHYVSTELTNVEIESKDCENCKQMEKQIQKTIKVDDNFTLQEQNNIIEDQCVNTELKSANKIFQNESKLSFTHIFKDNLNVRNNTSLFLDFLNQSDRFRVIKRLKNNISFTLCSNKISRNDLLIHNDSSNKVNKVSGNLNKLQILQNYEENKKMNHVDKNGLNVKFYKIFCQENLNSQLSVFIKMLSHVITTEVGTLTEQNNKLHKVLRTFLSHSQTVDSHVTYETVLKSVTMKISKDTQTDSVCNQVLLLNKSNLKSLQSIWTSLSESIFNNFKIHKVILFMDKSWIFLLESIKDIINHNSEQPELKELLIKKEAIESQLKDLHLKNLQTLSFNLITAVQFVTILGNNSSCAPILTDNLNNLLSSTLSNYNLENHSTLKLRQETYISKKIINIKRRIDNFHYLTNLYEKNLTSTCVPTNISEDKEHKNCLKKLPDNDIDISQSQQFQNYLKVIHEKYELKLEKMKEKMKSVYNNQITAMKKDQEMLAMNKFEALQSKFEYQCYNHTEELKKYKKHISELTTQLWDVGEKLIIEKQKKEDFVQKYKEMKKCNIIDIQNPKFVKHDQENYDDCVVKPEKSANALQSIENTSIHKMQSVRGFQIMGNAFKTEDEEGEVFDTTYLTDMQMSRNSLSSTDLNRLSILQMRNSKCKPHLKSSYPAEMQIHPVPFSEDEIKTGSTSEEVFNDSLSQSLLTGKKVKRKDRTKTGTETPRRSRRFSNIFRKPRLSIDRK